MPTTQTAPAQFSLIPMGPVGPPGASGNQQGYDTVSVAQAAAIPAGLNWIYIAGYATIGIGGGWYKRSGVQPADPRRFQNANDNSWWVAATASNGAPAPTCLDITQLGAGQGVRTTDDSALLSAVLYSNSVGGGLEIYYPDGVYTHGPCATPLVSSKTSLRGQSRGGTFINLVNGGIWIQVGNRALAQTQQFWVGGFVLDYGVAPQTSQIAFYVENCLAFYLSDLFLRNATTLVECGSAGVAASVVDSFGAREIYGYSYNGGVPLFLLNNGAGLYMDEIQTFVAGVPNGVHGQPQATVLGTNFLQIGTGVAGVTWDTAVINNLFIQCYDNFLCPTDQCVSLDFNVTTSILTQNKSHVFNLVLTTGGGLASTRVSNCWMDCWEQDAILVSAPLGTFNDSHQFVNNIIAESGISAYHQSTVGAIANLFAFNRIAATNQSGTAVAAIYFQSGSGLSIIGNSGNFAGDLTAFGAWSSPIGVYVGANCDHYLVSENRLQGANGSIVVANDNLLSKARRCHNNLYADKTAFGGYATTNAVTFVSGVYQNTSPFVLDILIFGGTVSGISWGGVGLAPITGGTFRVEPGESLAVTGAGFQSYAKIAA